jgi:hypothetical protein
MKDARLELNRYISNPFDSKGRIASQLNFRELFRNKYDTETGGSPWVPSRYTSEDLLKAIQNRKVNLNPRLNFVPNSPFWDTKMSYRLKVMKCLPVLVGLIDHKNMTLKMDVQ